jgi:AraC-like DNA-binding protein
MSDAQALHVQRPLPALAERVECYWAGGSTGREGARELVLPSAAMSLIFSIDDDGAAAAVVTGPHSRPISLETSRGFTAIGVTFKVGGAFAFLENGSYELHNQTVRLDDLWHSDARAVEERMWTAQTLDEKFIVIQQTLLQRLVRSPARHPGVTHALREIDRGRGNCRVAALADDIGVSARRLGQLFAREVGFSPKLLNRMRRFREVLRLIDKSEEIDWTDIALSSGYYDQPHFNHEFRTFCGMSPSAYLQRRLSQTHVKLDG